MSQKRKLSNGGEPKKNRRSKNKKRLDSDFEILFDLYTNGKVTLKNLQECELLYLCKTCRNIYLNLEQYLKHSDCCSLKNIRIQHSIAKGTEKEKEQGEKTKSLKELPKNKPQQQSQQKESNKSEPQPQPPLLPQAEVNPPEPTKSSIEPSKQPQIQTPPSISSDAAIVANSKTNKTTAQQKSNKLAELNVKKVNEVQQKEKQSKQKEKIAQQPKHIKVMVKNEEASPPVVTNTEIILTASPPQVKQERRQQQEKIRQEAVMLSQNSTKESKLQRHMAVLHLSLKKYKCNFCEFKSNSKTKCNKHLQRFHEKDFCDDFYKMVSKICCVSEGAIRGNLVGVDGASHHDDDAGCPLIVEEEVEIGNDDDNPHHHRGRHYHHQFGGDPMLAMVDNRFAGASGNNSNDSLIKSVKILKSDLNEEQEQGIAVRVSGETKKAAMMMKKKVRKGRRGR